MELRKSDIGFLKQIISNKFDSNYSKYQEYLNQTRTSNTEIDFEKLAKLVLADKSLKMGQLYAECSKRDIANDGKHWLRIREMLGDKCKKAYCDAGSLKIGSVNGDFSILVSSGGGDEMMRYAVVEKNEFNENMLNYFGQIDLHSNMVLFKLIYRKRFTSDFGIYIPIWFYSNYSSREHNIILS